MLRAMSAPAAPCVLVVEHESAIADTVLYALRSGGYQVRHCLLGREALAQARAGGIDVVVLDVGLPDLGGFEACRERRRFSQVPVIFLTARNDEIDRVLGLELGADDDMANPFSLRELVARMRSRAGSGTARSRSRSTATAAASTTATPHWT
ncbi:response regulator [Xanthomonas translucens]|uniref:response regulator n=1 Tax=Xanthomonas campestris pv. translucens TaxID=343 RepID=UPI003CCEDACB